MPLFTHTLSDNDLEQLRHFCSKILQAYRIRTGCLRRRHDALQSIAKDIERLPEKPEVVQILVTQLSREQQVVGAVERKEHKFLHFFKRSNIDYTIRKLEEYRRKLPDKGKFELPPPWSREISAVELKVFFDGMVDFIRAMDHDLKHIKKRMKAEERFISNYKACIASESNWKALKTSFFFERFIRQWDMEIDANQKMIKHLAAVMTRNQKVINVGVHSVEVKKAAAGLVGGGLLYMLGGGSAKLLTAFPSYMILTASAAMLLCAFVSLLQTYVKEQELPAIYEDRKLLRAIEGVKGIKSTLWKKVFA